MNEVNLSSLVLLFSLRKHLLVFDEERPERQVIWTGFVSTHFPSLSSTLSLLVEEGIPSINDDSCFRIVNVFNCTRKEFGATTIFFKRVIIINKTVLYVDSTYLLTWLLTAPRHPFRPPHPTNSFWARWKFPPSLYFIFEFQLTQLIFGYEFLREWITHHHRVRISIVAILSTYILYGCIWIRA